MNWRRVRALLLKFAFICSRNTFRAMDVFFWPMMDLLVWGFLTVYMLRMGNTVPGAITFLIGSVIMWNVLYRAQQVISVAFLDDVWSRNLLNIFAGPVRVREYIAATYITGLIQSTIVILFLSAAAAVFYSFNILVLGIPLAALFINLLLMGWWLGLLTTGIIVRFGPPAEALAWAIPFLVQPVSAVFYPVSILPPWLQPVAKIIPSSYVFEGMRQIIEHKTFDGNSLFISFGLNVVFMIMAALVFRYYFEEARTKGLLAKYGT
ncbi:MAG: ABC transporter permease [Candidatus Obscuribacterales bacterium]|nr:ABC transporter permease [Candidatus Obscuribacterales bacterium]